MIRKEIIHFINIMKMRLVIRKENLREKIVYMKI